MGIHPTAIIGQSVTLGSNVSVGPYTVIEGEVSIGDNTVIMAHANIMGYTVIGKNCTVHMGVVLGNDPQDVAFTGERSYLHIGDNNTFREYCWIHRGTKPESATVIGNGNYFMGFSHAAHNCRIGNNAVIASNTLLAGYVEVGDNAFVSGNIVVHQFTRIGAYAMVSGLSAVNKDIPPYMLAGGRPAVVSGLNVVGLRRNGFSAEQRRSIKKAHDILFRSDRVTSGAIDALSELEQTPEIKAVTAFARSSQRGLCGSAGLQHNQPITSMD
ncbi:acyl-ACP--UDP-N-acetylglucosamine O-acyltransferase [bacterium]|nr:acyl-ACP--UDP-N-acetylglucosamine O-acyltransferase [bacterium]